MIDEIVPQDLEEAIWWSNIVRSKLNNEHEEQSAETLESKGVDNDDIIF